MFRRIVGEVIRRIRSSGGRQSPFDLEVGLRRQELLVISYYVPCEGHAGGLRILDIYRKIRELSPDINMTLFARIDNDIDWGLDEIYEIFDEVRLVSKEDFCSVYLKQFVDGRTFDFIDLQFHQSGKFIGLLRNAFLKAIIIFSPLEIQNRWIWERAGFKLTRFDLLGILKIIYFTIQEIYYAEGADLVVCVSPVDENQLQKILPNIKSTFLPTCVSSYKSKQFYCNNMPEAREEYIGFSDTPSVVYFAHWGSFENRANLNWYLNNVHPLVKSAIDNYKFLILGRGMSDREYDRFMMDSSVDLIGGIDDPRTIIEEATLGISPSVVGGGMKGKIHQYSQFKVPCVASTRLQEDMIYEHGVSILFAEEAEEFAQHCVSLLTNLELRRDIGNHAFDICMRRYTWENYSADIRKIYGFE